MNKPVQIVADIGGTNARFAYVQADSDELLGIEVFPCSDFPFFVDAIRAYMEHGHVEHVDKICLAVAGPIDSDWVDLPNNHWAFSRKELQESLAASVTIINDFSAQVLSIDYLADSELLWVGSPRPSVSGSSATNRVKAVIGPGTGLGVSAMMSGGHILASEAGHMSFAPVDAHQAALLAVLWERYQRVSFERLLSGVGLGNLYWANCKLDGFERELPAPEVTSGALAGDVYCLRAVNDFCSVLGAVAGDVGLMMGAVDGVYISGGIVPRLLDLFNQNELRRCFESKGRFSDMCSKIPLAIVVAQYPGLQGCVAALRKGL